MVSCAIVIDAEVADKCEFETNSRIIMPDTHKSLRLGDLLVEKGLITAPQLRQAIEVQKARYDKLEITSINTKH